MASLTLRDVRKAYEQLEVIHGVDLDIKDGEFVVFVGPSGCGKSTLLRMIAGLEEISGGSISIGDTEVNEVAASKRGVAMVFQTYALYPHMTVYKNMAFGLKQAKTPADEIDRRVRAAAEILQITDYLDRSPRHLSGGQRQRVAIGRAIVRDPKVFLFDEPLSNLDAALRVQTRLEIARLHERLKTTMIYVTHDQVEAMTLADKIVVLRDGIIEQVGSPIELYERPANAFVAQFIGSPKMNFLEKEIAVSAGWLTKNNQSVARVGVRSEHLEHDPNGTDGNVYHIEYLGGQTITHVKLEKGSAITLVESGEKKYAYGSRLKLKPMVGSIHLFNADGQLIDLIIMYSQ